MEESRPTSRARLFDMEAPATELHNTLHHRHRPATRTGTLRHGMSLGRILCGMTTGCASSPHGLHRATLCRSSGRHLQRHRLLRQEVYPPLCQTHRKLPHRQESTWWRSSGRDFHSKVPINQDNLRAGCPDFKGDLWAATFSDTSMLHEEVQLSGA